MAWYAWVWALFGGGIEWLGVSAGWGSVVLVRVLVFHFAGSALACFGRWREFRGTLSFLVWALVDVLGRVFLGRFFVV